MTEPLDRVKAFLHQVSDVDDHFTVRFGCAEITIGDLRAVVGSYDEEISSLKAVILSIQSSRQKAWDTLEAVHGIVSEKPWLRDSPKGQIA